MAGSAPTAAGARSWTIKVEAPCPWLTANDRRHPLAQSKLIKMWRGATYAAARVAKLPTGLLRVRIEAVAHFRGRAPVRDRENLAPTLKAVVDGLGPSREYMWRGTKVHGIGYGLFVDDDQKHVDGPHWTIGDHLEPKPYGNVGLITVAISELVVLP